MESKWVLVNSKDSYLYDSIKAADYIGKKHLHFADDSVSEYYAPYLSPASKFAVKVDVQRIELFSGGKIIRRYDYIIRNDTLIIQRYGRHGIVSDYYVPAEN